MLTFLQIGGFYAALSYGIARVVRSSALLAGGVVMQDAVPYGQLNTLESNI